MCVNPFSSPSPPKPAPLPLTPAPDSAETRRAGDLEALRRRQSRGFSETVATSPTGAPTPASAIAVKRLLGA